MNTSELPSPKLLRKLMRYDPRTGELFWRERTPDMFIATERRSSKSLCKAWNKRYAGKQTFKAKHVFGYMHGTICGKTISAHRVAWAILHNEWPATQIDHIDGNPANNKQDNIRLATAAQNSQNRKLPKHNTSGIKGVFWSKHKNRWHARIGHNGKKIHIGYFKTKRQAATAYANKASSLHGEFFRVA